jgi:hypothetical protein
MALWAAGGAAVLALWLVRWSRLRATLRTARAGGIAAPMPVKMSGASLEPGLVGIVRPVLLLPEGIAEKLTEAELQSIIAHEACHLRRRDNLTAALHMLAEVIFWFWPPVWWLGTRLIAEREKACDEAVLQSGSDPQTYAESILKVCKFYVASPLACAAGVSGADLRQRMEDIMRNTVIARLNLTKKALLAASAAALLALPLLLGLPLSMPMAMAEGTPAPGSEAALRRQIEAWERKAPLYAEMAPAMANTYTREREQSQAMIDGWGALKSVAFRQKDGARDVYLVEFEKGTAVWTIEFKDGKVAFLLFLPAIHRTDSGPSAGTEAALRRIMAGLAQGRLNSAGLTAAAMQSAQQQLPLLTGDDFGRLGALRGLSFVQINPRGWDVFSASHEHGTSSWTIAPLKDGKVDAFSLTNISLSDVQPRPGTEQSLRRYIASLERGQPNYEEMSPGMAEAVRGQLPDILAAMKPLGAPRAFTFKGRGLGDMDTYEVAFEHGTVEFRIGPLTADGKVERRGFTILNE